MNNTLNIHQCSLLLIKSKAEVFHPTTEACDKGLFCVNLQLSAELCRCRLLHGLYVDYEELEYDGDEIKGRFQRLQLMEV